MPFDLTGYRIINGTNRANTLVGTSGQDAIFGFEGNDTLTGNGGSDILDGGTGSDRMTGGLGHDIYVVDSTGDTTVEAEGEGIDTVYSTVTRTLSANVENLFQEGTSAINATGNVLNNVIRGNIANNRLLGADGNDKINGGDGVDTLDGGSGKDVLHGEKGNDIITGGAGNDTLNGGHGDDSLNGGTENDGLFGGGGQDTLLGGAGNDKIFGDGGNDRIQGGTGSDVLSGGSYGNAASAGTDTFVWVRSDVVASGAVQGFDRVLDFGTGDRIDFTGLNLSHTRPIDQVIHVKDTAAGTVISANFGGSYGFVDVVVIEGVHNTTLADLVDGGALEY